MLFEPKEILLKNGQKALFRSPAAEDAAEMMECLKTCCAETNFIMRYPEECTETVDQEAAFLTGLNASSSTVMIVCLIDGKIAGNCQLKFMDKRLKTRHRATIAIGILQKYWGLGIGTAMFSEMIAMAKARGVLQLELEFIEGNDRGRALYEKMGFRLCGERPDAYQLKDGTLLKEYMMIKKL